MATEQQQEPQKNRSSKLSQEQLEEVKVLEEKVSKNGGLISLHFDFKNTPPSKTAYKEQFENKFQFREGLIDVSKREFWFNLLYAGQSSFFSGQKHSSDEETVEKMIDAIDDNLIEQFFNRIEKNFASSLKKIIADNRGYHNSFFNFRIRDVSYGSLDLLVEVANARSLAEKFNENLDFFIGFLEMYAPIALIQSIGLPHVDANLLYSTVDISKEFEGEFEGNKIANELKSPPDKLQKFFTLVKFSWVVPILLSLLILYLTYHDAKEAKSFYMDNYNSILKQQQELLKLQNDFIKLEFTNRQERDTAISSVDSLRN